MADKVQKIREEVERLHNEYRNKKGALYFRKALRTVLFIIDSMQEECNITDIKSKHATGKLKELVDNVSEEGLEEARKQLEELTKECIYSKDNYTAEDRKVLCEGCEEECKFNKKEEPVSEEFEKALAEEWQGYVDRGAATVDALEDNTQELAFAKGFYRGANWQKEQMIKNAKELVVDELDWHIYNFALGCLGVANGDRVKVIVIKEE